MDLRWHRGELVIVEKPTRSMQTVLRLAEGVRWPAGGVFATAEAARGGSVVRPPGGVYEAAVHVDEMLRDLGRVEPKDVESVRGFVSRWGRLGVGFPQLPDAPVDGVRATQAALADLKAIGDAIGGGEVPAAWGSLEERLNGLTERLVVVPQVVGQELQFVFRPSRLYDLLALEVVLLAVEHARLGTCQRCGGWIVRPRGEQRYCSTLCAKQVSVGRAKLRLRVRRLVKEQVAERAITGMILASPTARRSGVTAADVRNWVAEARADAQQGRLGDPQQWPFTGAQRGTESAGTGRTGASGRRRTMG